MYGMYIMSMLTKKEDDALLASLILINWCSQRWAVTQSPEAGLGHWPHLVTVTRIMMLSQDKYMFHFSYI